MTKRAASSALGVLALSATSLAQICTTTRLDVDVQGNPANGISLGPWISPDARFVLFDSFASNLVAGDANGFADVFLIDRALGGIEIVSAGAGHLPANGRSGSGRATPDGRFVVFVSAATNLVPGDSNGLVDVFLRDRLLDTIVRVNVGVGGEANADSGAGFDDVAAISDDGRFVAFMSNASNLVVGDTNSDRDVFVRDVSAGTTLRVSLSPSGTQSTRGSGWPSMSTDGRFVAFVAYDGGLLPGDGNSSNDVFVKDVLTGALTLVSVASGGLQIGNQPSQGPSLSADGQRVAFISFSNNLVPVDINNQPDAFLHDLTTRATTLLSRGMSGAGAIGATGVVQLTRDGQRACMTSRASNLVPNYMSGTSDVFVADTQSGSAVCASVSNQGQPVNYDSYGGWVSADGTAIVFSSAAPNLIAGVTNGPYGIYLRDQPVPPLHGIYCFGTSILCPCGNVSEPWGGCSNRDGYAAALAGIGNPSVASDTVQLVVTGTPSSASVLFLQGDMMSSAGSGVPFGDGLLCLDGTLRRLGTSAAISGASSIGHAIGPLVSIRGAVPAGGASLFYQGWYRDPLHHCTPATFNLTNGLRIDWVP